MCPDLTATLAYQVDALINASNVDALARGYSLGSQRVEITSSPHMPPPLCWPRDEKEGKGESVEGDDPSEKTAAIEKKVEHIWGVQSSTFIFFLLTLQI